MSEKLKVKSVDRNSFLVTEYKFEPSLKKHGNVRSVQKIGFNGGPYSFSVFAEDGKEISDKSILESIDSAIREHKCQNQKSKVK